MSKRKTKKSGAPKISLQRPLQDSPRAYAIAQVVNTPLQPDYRVEQERLYEVFDQMWNLFRCRSQLQRKLAQLEDRNDVLAAQLRNSQQNTQTKDDARRIELIKGRRSQEAMQQLIVTLAEIADSLRMAIDAEMPAVESQESSQWLRRVLDQTQQALVDQSVKIQFATVGDLVDVQLFEVAATIDDEDREEGTITRACRPAYIQADGKVYRKGAVVVSKRGTPLTQVSDLHS